MRRIYGFGFEFVWNYRTLTSLQTGFDTAVQVVDLFESGSIRNVQSFMEKDKVYVRSSSVRLIFVTEIK